MAYKCTRCNRVVEKIVALGNAEDTAWVSDDNVAPWPVYDYLCVNCALEVLQIKNEDLPLTNIPLDDILSTQEIEAQKNLMIAVGTGGPRIQDKNHEYQERRTRIKHRLLQLGIDDPNPFADLWAWYGKWSGGDLPTYQSRRKYIADLYQPLLDYLKIYKQTQGTEPVHLPTGWARVDRSIDAIRARLETAKNEEDYQTVGLLCRETLISLAQAVFDASIHKPTDGVSPSDTDANRMLEAYFVSMLEGSSNEPARKHAKAALALANDLQHRRTATFKNAALCAEATRTVVNIIAIISGKREP